MKLLILFAVLLVATQARKGPRTLELQVNHARVQDIYRPHSGSSRIISGGSAARSPYNVAIYLNGRSLCDGSLISQRWVLTAAVCASGISTFTIYLGTNNLNANSESGRVIVETTSKIVHSGFSSLLLKNNVALVNLNQNIALSNYIQPVSLPNGTSIYAGEIARLTGWKLNSAGSGSTMQSVNLTILSSSECNGSSISGSSLLCAVFPNGTSSCGVSPGGPLVHIETNQQIGVVSHTSADCAQGAPVFFSRVSSYVSWITSNTGIAS